MLKTTSLQLSKDLKEAGFPQKDCGNYWVEFEHNSTYADEGVESRTHIYSYEKVHQKNYKERNFWDMLERGKNIDNIIAAPTAEEILEKLPHILKYNNLVPHLKIEKTWFKGVFSYMVYYEDYQQGTVLEGQDDKSLAEAAGKMFLYLKKEGLI